MSTIINMLRGGKGNGNSGKTFTYNMYPRPDLYAENMPEKMGSTMEVPNDSKIIASRWNACQCHNHGAIKRAKEAAGSESCSLEVGDEIPLVWVPNRHTIEAVSLTVNNGIAGVEVSLKRYSVAEGKLVIEGAVEEEVLLPGTSAAPHSVPLSAAEAQAEIDALACGERYDLQKYCSECDSQGCYYEHWFDDKILVGQPSDPAGGVCAYGGQYFSLVIDALPDDFNCSSCCLDISVAARVRIPYLGE